MKASFLFVFVSALFFFGCSNTSKMRQEQREKVAATSGLFCDFVSGDDHKDVDVELNFQMAKRCDVSRNFSITNYKSSAEVNGLVYCCAMKKPAAPAPTSASVSPAAPQKPASKDSKDVAPVLGN